MSGLTDQWSRLTYFHIGRPEVEGLGVRSDRYVVSAHALPHRSGAENRSRLVFRVPQCMGIGFSGAQESGNQRPRSKIAIQKSMTFVSLVNFDFAIVSISSESVSVHYIEVPRRAGNSRQRKSGTGQSESGTKPHCFEGKLLLPRDGLLARIQKKARRFVERRLHRRGRLRVAGLRTQRGCDQ